MYASLPLVLGMFQPQTHVESVEIVKVTSSEEVALLVMLTATAVRTSSSTVKAVKSSTPKLRLDGGTMATSMATVSFNSGSRSLVIENETVRFW